MFFLTLFQFLTWLLTSKHLKLFSTYLRGEMERCEKRAFQLLKMRKENQRNIKAKCVTDILLTVRSTIWRIIPSITWWAHKRQTFTLISIKIMRIWKLFLKQVTGYLNTRKWFPFCMFVIISSGKYDLNVHFTILQEF